jgi:hypothetical protein
MKGGTLFAEFVASIEKAGTCCADPPSATFACASSTSDAAPLERKSSNSTVWSFSTDEDDVDIPPSGPLGYMYGSGRLPLFAFLENEPRMQLAPSTPIVRGSPRFSRPTSGESDETLARCVTARPRLTASSVAAIVIIVGPFISE